LNNVKLDYQVLSFYGLHVVGTMFPRIKEQKLSNNEEKKRGMQLKLVEIPEHEIVCSCALIQYVSMILLFILF
jgi:hypothetical protein